MEKPDFRSTRQVARLLGLNCNTLGRAIWDGRLPAPRRAPGRAFLWEDADIDRARRLFGVRRR